MVREWWLARKQGLRIARAEKVYLALALPGALVMQLAADQILPSGVPVFVCTIVVVLNGWVLQRRLQRTR